MYVIQDNKYSIPVNVIIKGQVLICQEAGDKSCHNKGPCQVVACLVLSDNTSVDR